MRRVISLWLPYLATDRLRRPGSFGPGRSDPRADLRRGRGHPLVTVRDEGGRCILVAVDAAAAAAGLRPGLPLADARALAPGLDVRPADPIGEAETLARLAEWCGRYSPWTAVETAEERVGGVMGAGIWLDVTGCAHLFGGEAALLDDLLRRLRRLGYAARAALADTPGAAWALARFGRVGGDGGGGDVPTAMPVTVTSGGGLVLAPGAMRAALAPLSVAALRLAPAVVEGLDRLGLRRVADLYPLPRATLTRRFGSALGLRLDQALGHVAEPISPRPPAAAHHARLTFAEPVAHADGLAEGLRRLTAALCDSLAAAALGARRLELVLYRVDGSLGRTGIGTSRPTRDPAALRRLLLERLEGFDPGFGIEAMALATPETEALPPRQPALAGRVTDDSSDDAGLAPLIDRLGNRLGFDRILRFVPRESHLPERAVAPAPALAPKAAAAWRTAPRADLPRPVRLLARPEPVEAMALLPDHPPALFRWRARLHRVARAAGPERIAPEWWRRLGESAEPLDGAGKDRARDYFQVEDAEGRRFWLYREGAGGTGRWYLHGLFA